MTVTPYEEHHVAQLGLLGAIESHIADLARAAGEHGYMHPLAVRSLRSPIGGSQTVVVTAAAVVALDVPKGARFARITVETAQVRFWDDASPPSATAGHLLNAGDVLDLDSDPWFFRAIAVGGNATLQVSYYR